MSTLHVSEKTNQGMPPQFLARESTPADKPGVGTKRGVETRSEDRVAGVQHGRGETGNGAGNLSLRHPVGAASAIFDGGVRGAVSVDAVQTTAQGCSWVTVPVAHSCLAAQPGLAGFSGPHEPGSIT